MNIKKIFIVLSIIAAIILLISHFLKTDRERILEQLSSLEEIVYLRPGETPIKKATRLKQAGQYFTEAIEIVIELKYRETKLIRTRQELTDSLLFISQRLEHMNIRFMDSKVRMENEDRAFVHTTVKVTYEEPDLFQAVEFEIGFEKVDGEWLIQRVKNIQAIEF